MSKVQYRKFNISDYENLILFWESSGLTVKNKGRDSKAEIEKELDRGIAHFILAYMDQKLIGACLLTHDGRKGWINRLAVHPDYRRRGIARKIIQKAETYFDKIGIGIIACLIEDYNQDSLNFFQKTGYIDFERIHYLTKRKHTDF